MSVESVDSPRDTVGGDTVGGDTVSGGALAAARRIARWSRAALEEEADRFRFAISERGVLHRLDRPEVEEDLQNVYISGERVVRASNSRPHFCCLHSLSWLRLSSL